MSDILNDKIIVVELAGKEIILRNTSNNFKNELIAMGFRNVGSEYFLVLPIEDIDNRVLIINKLIDLGGLFSGGNGWTPSEVVDYYKEKGLINAKYNRISWKAPGKFTISTE
jgi:hypothetical protein BACCOPRO_01420